jgi:ABC-type glycerol-3-phosphate transport system permease component
MSFLGTAILAFWADVDPSGEADYVDWHNREHMPERCAVPGFLRGRRYVAVAAAPKYFMMYETETLATLASPAYVERLNNPTPWTQKCLALFRNSNRTACRTTVSMGRGIGGAVAKVFLAEFARAWEQASFGNYFLNSIVVVVAVVIISVFLTILSGYAMGQMKFRGKGLINIIILMGLMVPFEAVIIPLWSLMRELKLYNTIWALIWPQVALSFSFGTFWMQTYFRGVPGDLVDAAETACRRSCIQW